jgi:hypothetical protein
LSARWLRIRINRIDPQLFSQAFLSWVTRRRWWRTTAAASSRRTGAPRCIWSFAFATRERLVLGREAVAEGGSKTFPSSGISPSTASAPSTTSEASRSGEAKAGRNNDYFGKILYPSPLIRSQRRASRAHAVDKWLRRHNLRASLCDCHRFHGD